MKYNPDIHHRHSIRLEGFDYSSNGAYFITICVQDRAMLFSNIVGAALCGRPGNADQMIKKWLKEIENKFPDMQIDDFVIMPNHIHFILRIQGQGGHTGPPLHEAVDWFKTMTTNEYIKGVKAGLYHPFNKRVWQRNYYEHIIRSEGEYKNIREYILTNPAKWATDEYYSV